MAASTGRRTGTRIGRGPRGARLDLDALDLGAGFDALAQSRAVALADLPPAPEPRVLAGMMLAVFGHSEVPLRAVAALRGVAPGRALAELECLRALGVVATAHPGFYWCTEHASEHAPCVDEQDLAAAVAQASRWYLASARATAGFLPGGVLPAAHTGDLPEPDPAIFDAYSALAWSQQARPTLLALARTALDQGSYRLVVDLALAAIQAAMADNALAAWRELAELMLTAARASRDQVAEGFGLEYVGKALTQGGELEQALRVQLAALALRRRAGDAAGLVYSANAVGLVHYRAGRPARAARWFTAALKLAERYGQEDFAAYTRQNLALVTLDDPRSLVQALDWLTAAARRHQWTGALHAYANCARLTASAIRQGPGGHPRLALSFARLGLDAVEDCGKIGLSGHEYAEVGRCVSAAGHPQRATAWFEAAQLLFHAAGDTERERQVREEFGLDEPGTTTSPVAMVRAQRRSPSASPGPRGIADGVPGDCLPSADRDADATGGARG